MSTPVSSSPRRAPLSRSTLLVLAFGAFLLLWNLGYAPFWNPDEGRYAAASIEMARGFDGNPPDWVIPHLNTIVRLNKPPLVYWLGATWFNLFGAHEWAGRLGSAFAAIGVMLVLWQIGRRTWGEHCGLFAAMIWTTSLFPFGMARVMNTDMLLCGAITLGVYGLWRAIEAVQDDAANFRFDAKSFVIAGLGMGLALLAKGPVGLAFPLVIAFFHLLIARRWVVFKAGRAWLGVLLAVIVALAIAIPWYAAVNARDPHFLKQFLVGENLSRFSGGKDFHDATSPFFYIPVVMLGLLPWSPLLIIAVLYLASEAPSTSILQRNTTILGWTWAVLVIGLFSLSSTKLISYVLPAFPALVLLMAAAVHRLLNYESNISADQESPTPYLFVPLLGFNLLLALAFLYLPFEPTRLLDTIMVREVAAPWLIAAAAVLLTGSFFVWKTWKQAQYSRAVAAQWGTIGLFYVVLLAFIGRAAPYEDSSFMIRGLAPHLKPEDRLVQFYFQPTSIFYVQRPVYQVGFKNTSGLPDEDINRSRYFIDPVEPDFDKDTATKADLAEREVKTLRNLKTFLEDTTNPGQNYVLIRTKDWNKLATKPKAPHVIGRSNDVLLLSNRPAPAGYKFDFVAPKEAEKNAQSLQSSSTQ